jgi:hypothetical protein
MTEFISTYVYANYVAANIWLPFLMYCAVRGGPRMPQNIYLETQFTSSIISELTGKNNHVRRM